MHRDRDGMPPDDIREMIRTQEHMLANPDAPTDPPPPVATYLTRASVQAAIAQLMTPPPPDPYYAQQELALARWINEQPPGTAGKLLERMYGRTGDTDV